MKNRFFALLFAGLMLCAASCGTPAADAGETDYAMIPPVIWTGADIPAEYNYASGKLDYHMTIGIERSAGGRIWACWVGGGDNEDAFFLLKWSDDGGDTWSQPKAVIDPHSAAEAYPRRIIVGTLWTDPKGRLWLFMDQSVSYYDGRAGTWAAVCENPDDEEPVWSEAERIWHGCVLNKPVVLSSGEWILPLYLWGRGMILSPYFTECHHELDTERRAYAFVSTDEGKTWERSGGVSFPYRVFDEHHIVELQNGDLWMTARTNDGIWQSFSNDKGKTWSVSSKYMKNTSSRHFLTRLASGNLLFVKNGGIDEQVGRCNLTAFISEDDGATWKGGLLLDERFDSTYPDGFQAPDGTICVSYDIREKQVLMARFRESDVLAGAFESPGSRAKIVISEARFGLD